MATFILKAMLPLLLLSFTKNSYYYIDGTVHGEYEQWCVADEQTSDSEVQAALDWACGRGGADCNKIQVNQPCYFPNTLQNHASFAFNSYFQKFKHKGGSCYFRGAALVTELDPSYGSCHYDFIP